VSYGDEAKISREDPIIKYARFKSRSVGFDYQGFQLETDNKDEQDTSDDRESRKLELRIRSAIPETTYDPYHDKMKEAIKKLLDKSYKKEYKKVRIEKERVDIQALTHNERLHFFEIKTNNVKMSIRAGIGQILEYAYWPNVEKADKLIIVSDREPDQQAIEYLNHIRLKFNLPVHYRFYDPSMNYLSKDF
jgi:hypothetical protein